MIATLSMYDWPGQSAHWDAFWSAIRDALRARDLPAPEALTRDGNLWEHWESPELVLGQTCGMPFRTRLHGRVELVGTLDHGLPDAPPGHYYSVLVARAGDAGEVADFAGRRLAYNSADSQSGWAAPQTEAARHGFHFARALETGAHSESARAVAEGRADIAAIDAETWRLVETYLPDIVRRLRVVGTTEPTPGLPLIAARTNNGTLLAEAVTAALSAVPQDTLGALHVRGFVVIPAADYLAVPTPAGPSKDVRAL